MEILTYILAIPFLYFNYKIVSSDIKTKKIPNKYLGYLLILIPFWWAILFTWIAPNYLPWIWEINILLFWIQIIATFIVSFILYYFWIWAAGDAKYLLVLSIFIPYIGIIPFIGNIALITIVYLLCYFIYFYFGKLLFYKVYRKSLFSNIKQDLIQTWKVYKWNKGWNTYKVVAKFLLVFLIIFVSIRLSRIYLFNSVIQNSNNIKIFSEIIQKYGIYLVFLWVGLFIWGLYIFKLLLNKAKIYLSKRLNLDLVLIWNILLSILFILLISFISYELLNNYQEISNLLVRVFTLYLWIYIIIKVLFYGYKITFWIAEIQYKDIWDLKEGDVVDKINLINIFWHQTFLWYQNNSWILWPKPSKYFQNIQNPINKNTALRLKSIYKKYNNYQIQRSIRKNIQFTENNSIKTIKTTAFAVFIYLSFIVTFLITNEALLTIIYFVQEIINHNIHIKPNLV